MKKPIWLTRHQVLAFHEEQLHEHGGLAGVRDDTAFEGALARPNNIHHYEATDLFALAAAYAHGFAKNHPFLDGNKRTAFSSAAVFLYLNGLELTLSESKAYEITVALASGALAQKGFADFLRENSKKI